MKKKVSFTSKGSTLVGNLYLPENYEEGKKIPGVVITGSWTSVKEQMPGLYASEMAKRGYAALAFDFRGWGESADDIRYLEDPLRKKEDILAAAEHLAGRAEVDGARIGGIGICASSGYMSDAPLESPHIKSVALIAPWLHDAELVMEVYGGEEGVQKLIQAGEEAASSSEPVVIEAASATNEKCLMYQVPYYTEKDRGLIPEYDNRFNVASWVGWLTYDAIKTAGNLEKPVLLVHSEAAAIPQGAKKYAARMGEKAKTVWLDEITQFDFYDRPDAVKASADAAAKHFRGTLG